jgi:hypothetical protein
MHLFQRALLLLATAAEGLIQSDANSVAKQFRERLPRLAEEVGIAGGDEQFARNLYTARSEAAHGAQVSMFHLEPTPEQAVAGEGPEQPHGEPEPPEAANGVAAPLALAQDLVRAATRKAIEDAAFRIAADSRCEMASRDLIVHATG